MDSVVVVELGLFAQCCQYCVELPNWLLMTFAKTCQPIFSMFEMLWTFRLVLQHTCTHRRAHQRHVAARLSRTARETECSFYTPALKLCSTHQPILVKLIYTSHQLLSGVMYFSFSEVWYSTSNPIHVPSILSSTVEAFVVLPKLRCHRSTAST
jgi:hypothetical protein